MSLAAMCLVVSGNNNMPNKNSQKPLIQTNALG